jgi:hypothetical protein
LAQGNAKQAVADLTDASTGPNPNGSKLFHLALAQAAAGDLNAANNTLKQANRAKLNLKELSLFEQAKYEALVKQLGGQA